MSHVVQIQTQVRDEAAIAAACRRLKLAAPVRGTFPLFSGQVSGVAVQLPEWRYPIVCDMANGSVQFDNFGGYWGKSQELNRFLQAYAVEKARLEARKVGRSVSAQTLANGSIKLTIQVSGGEYNLDGTVVNSALSQRIERPISNWSHCGARGSSFCDR